jgi:hypothetical protein
MLVDFGGINRGCKHTPTYSPNKLKGMFGLLPFFRMLNANEYKNIHQSQAYAHIYMHDIFLIRIIE